MSAVREHQAGAAAFKIRRRRRKTRSRTQQRRPLRKLRRPERAGIVRDELRGASAKILLEIVLMFRSPDGQMTRSSDRPIL